MSDKPVIVATVSIDELAAAMVQAMEKVNKPDPATLYTRAQAARKLGKAYNTIDRMILQKRLITTPDGKYISQRNLDKYAHGEQ